MFPLLIRDGLRVPYFAVCAIFLSLYVLYIESENSESEIKDKKKSVKKSGTIKVGEQTLPLSRLILNRMTALFIYLSCSGK